MSQQDPNLPLLNQDPSRMNKDYVVPPPVIPVMSNQPAPPSVVLASATEAEGAQQQLSELAAALENVNAQMEFFNRRISKLEEKLTLFSKKNTKPTTPAEKKKRNEIRKFFKDKTAREENLLADIK